MICMCQGTSQKNKSMYVLILTNTSGKKKLEKKMFKAGAVLGVTVNVAYLKIILVNSYSH